MLKRFDEFGRDLESIVSGKSAREATLRCAACGAVVSRRPDAIRVNGAHRHRCVNPHGFTFEIGCFRHAEATRGSGEHTLRDTWFSGYAWRIQVCGGCGTHLGWRFSRATDCFYGLIVERVRED